MSDPITAQFFAHLKDLKLKRKSAENRLQKALADIEALTNDEDAIIRALRLVGVEVPPENGTEAPTRPVAGEKKMRAIDVVLQVVNIGETVRAQEVASRVEMRGLEVSSSSPANAIATAMSRSDDFRRISSGVFERVDPNDPIVAAERIQARPLQVLFGTDSLGKAKGS